MRRIVLYCRVSTDTQEKNETIENQLRDLYKVYDKKEVGKVYQDNPGSGADPDRAGLTELRRDAQKKLFDVIGIWSTDRLARDIKLALTLRDEFKDLGIKVEVMGRERDDSDNGKLLAILEAAMDDIERGRIKRRFTAGKERKLAEGKLIGCSAPYGRTYMKRDREKGIDGYFKTNEKELGVIKKVFKWYLELESIFLVTRRLYEKKIKARNGKYFYASTVKKILINEGNIGNHYYGKSSPCIAKFHIHKIRKHKITGRRKNPRTEWKLVKIEPLIDEKLFYKAQEIMKKRGRHDSRIKQSKYHFLCKGLIRCIHCNRLYGTKLQNEFQLYRCPQIRMVSFNEPSCHSRSMARKKLDNFVWEYVKTLIENGDILKNKIRDKQEKRKADMSSNQRVYDSLIEERNSLKSKKNKLLELYSDESISDKSKQDIKTKLKEFDEREEGLGMQVLQAEKELQLFENMNQIEREVEESLEKYRGKTTNPDFELKRSIVRKFIEEINVLDNGAVVLKVNFSDSISSDLSSFDDRAPIVVGESCMVNQGIHYTKKVRNKIGIKNGLRVPFFGY